MRMTIKNLTDLPDKAFHYTVDHIYGSDSFIINIKGGGASYDSVAHIDDLHDILKLFSNKGYIADRIAF